MVELDSNPLSDANSTAPTSGENRANASTVNIGNSFIDDLFELENENESELVSELIAIGNELNSSEMKRLKAIETDVNTLVIPNLIKVEQKFNDRNFLNQINASGNSDSMSNNSATVSNYGVSESHETVMANANNVDYSPSLFYKANIKAIKHDHPFAAKIDDTFYDDNLNDIDLISSSPLSLSRSKPNLKSPSASATVTSSNAVAMNANSYRNDQPERYLKLPYCLPYGYCRDDGPPAKKFSSLIFDDDDWLISNTIVNNEKDNSALLNFNDEQFNDYDKPLKMEDAFQLDKMDLKSGPTLAELNFSGMGDFDYGDILLSYSNNETCKKPAYNLSPSLKKASPMLANAQQYLNSNQQNLSSLAEDEQKLKESPEFFNTVSPSSTQANTNGETSLAKAIPPQAVSFQAQLQKPSVKRASSPSPLEGTPPAKLSASALNSKLRSSNNLYSQSSAKTKTVSIQEKSKLTASSDLSKQNPSNTTVLSTLLSSPTNIIENKHVRKISEECKQMDIHNLQVPESHLKSRRRNNSMSTDCSFSSREEEFDSDSDDSDDESFYGDYEAKDLLGASTSDDKNNKWALNMGRSRKAGAQRYFWQYNIQSKGPKGTRIRSLEESSADPHVLCEASDPVFSSDCHIEGVKHAGKARRGDGNDLTPNPRKLLMIGLELKKLSKTINDLTPVAELPQLARNKSRKEKNKLASRACRLKKKAQHEANKIKLYGLQQEHKKIMTVIIELKDLLKKSQHTKGIKISYSTKFEQIVAQLGPRVNVAGRTTDFVNSVLDNVASGITDGDLEKL